MSEHKERKTLEERQQMSDLERLRHSCAHVLATAICRLWPDAQLAGGPAVDNGFYYDVELDHRISTEDFERIEEEMKKVVKENQVFQKEVISRADAMKMAESGELGALGPRSEPSRFKIDLLNDIPEDEEISLYRNGDFTDLCAGPHVGRTGNCKAFKIMSVASAFYKGDKNRPMLQRIYGTCFPNRAQLDEHLERLEEARRRDHRKLGRELGLFCIDESVGQGLILWKPKGALIRRSLQDFITEELDKLGYSQVYTPNIGKLDQIVSIMQRNIQTNLSATDLTWFVTKAVGVNLDSGVSGDALPGDGSVTYGSTRYCYELEPGKSLEMINRLVNPYTASLTAEDVNIFQVSKQNGRGYRATASDFQTTDSSTDTTTGRDPEYD